MSDDWELVASHGMTESEVRSALRMVVADKFLAWKAEQTAADVLPAVINRQGAILLRLAFEEIEQILPVAMRDMAITAGAASLH